MDMWHDVDQAFKSKLRLDKTDFLGKEELISTVWL